MKKIYIILGAFFLLGNNLIAQNHWCATDEKFAEMAKQNNLVSLEKGIYFINISDGNKSITKKIIKY